jgi:hypothetical protein
MVGHIATPRSRSLPSWCLLPCVLAFAVVPATASAVPTPAECDARANETPSKLVECIQADDLWAHVQAFQEIANANPGPDGQI